MRRHSTTTLFTAFLISGSLLLAGCGGDDKGSDAKGSDGTSDVKHEDKAATWPLTGLPVEKGESAELEHPVLVTKVDNTGGSAPQVGLGEADLVVEEAVEGRVTRLAVFYYSDLPDLVGPVRSMRASDIGIVSPIDGTMVTSGAAQVTIDRLKGAHVPFVQEGDGSAFSRATDRSAPYNLMANLDEVAKSDAKTKAARPDDYLPWGDPKDLPKGQKASTISAKFGPAHTTQWQYADGEYRNVNSYAADGDQFPASGVLALTVEVGDAGYTDPAGNPVPETKFTGSGDAVLFHDGRAVRGTWSKETLKSELKLETKGGDLAVPPGRIWVELVPQDTGSVTFK